MYKPTPTAEDLTCSATDQLTQEIPALVLKKFAARLVNRWDTYAIPGIGKRWLRVEGCLTLESLERHLCGLGTVGLYERDQEGFSRWGVFDADNRKQTLALHDIQVVAVEEGIPLLIEGSRHGRAHGWMLIREPMLTEQLRDALTILSGGKVKEIFPKACSLAPFGNLVRAPGGVHPQTREVYPFEGQDDTSPASFAAYIAEAPTATPAEVLRLLNRREELLHEVKANEQRIGSLVEQIHAKLNPLEVLGWFDVRPTKYSETTGKLDGPCPFHPDETPSFAAWRTKSGRWHWCCHSKNCPTYEITERGQRVYDLISLVAMKKLISDKEAIGQLAMTFGFSKPGFKRILTPQSADGYSCKAFERAGWSQILPEIVTRGYRVLAELERGYNLPAFGERTAKAIQVDGAQDDRPWLICSYRRFAKKLTGNARNLGAAARVLQALSDKRLIEICKGKRRAKNARSIASCILRVWPVPEPSDLDKSVARTKAAFPGSYEIEGWQSQAPALPSDNPSDSTNS